MREWLGFGSDTSVIRIVIVSISIHGPYDHLEEISRARFMVNNVPVEILSAYLQCYSSDDTYITNPSPRKLSKVFSFSVASLLSPKRINCSATCLEGSPNE